MGFPISTTHALTGGLVGAGVVAVGSHVNFNKLGSTFFLPLLISPLIAVPLGALLYGLFHALRLAIGISEETCVCLDKATPVSIADGTVAKTGTAVLEMTIDATENCVRRYKGTILGISCQPVIDVAHFVSAGAVCFARGMNDTPKIVALMLVIKPISVPIGMFVVAGGMAVGGLLNAKKVAETMSKKITPMNHGQGFTANLVTAALVIFASKLGVPVSTTHVSVGTISGIGIVTRKVNLNVVGQIALSWLLTLPIASFLSATIYFFSR
jgi:PiT family inorganic phosphate transporter